jgi:hypothetical protein
MQAGVGLLIHSRAHQRWIGFSEDDGSSPTAQDNQAATPQLRQRVEDNAFHLSR